MSFSICLYALTNPSSPHGYTALHLAALHNNVQVAYLLLRERLPGFKELPARPRARPSSRYSRPIEPIDVDVQDVNGNTALHLAASEGNLDIVTMLCESGAKVDFKNDNSLTALDLAIDQRVYQVRHLPVSIISNFYFAGNNDRLSAGEASEHTGYKCFNSSLGRGFR